MKQLQQQMQELWYPMLDHLRPSIWSEIWLKGGLQHKRIWSRQHELWESAGFPEQADSSVHICYYTLLDGFSTSISNTKQNHNHLWRPPNLLWLTHVTFTFGEHVVGYGILCRICAPILTVAWLPWRAHPQCACLSITVSTNQTITLCLSELDAFPFLSCFLNILLSVLEHVRDH